MDENDFEDLFKKGMYYLRFALVDPKSDIQEAVKGWMKEVFIEARRTLREKIDELEHHLNQEMISVNELSLANQDAEARIKGLEEGIEKVRHVDSDHTRLQFIDAKRELYKLIEGGDRNE